MRLKLASTQAIAASVPIPTILSNRPKTIMLLAGLASAAGFAPLDLWPLTLACLALLIVQLERAPSQRAAFALGWCFGLGHFTIGLNWIAHAFTFQEAMPHWFGYGAVAMVALYLAVFPGLAAVTAWKLDRLFARLPGRRTNNAMTLPFLLAATWIATEYLRATLFSGFAWNPLGILWVPTIVAPAATWVGTYGASALAILAAAAALMAVRRWWLPAAVLFAPVVGLALLGTATQLLSVRSSSPVAIRIVQPNIGQQDKYEAAFEAENFAKLTRLSGPKSATARLLFWPEAAIPAYLDLEPQWRQNLALLLGPGDLLMTGGDKIYFKDQDKGAYADRVMAGANNSLWVVTPDGRLIGRYDKAHLVPYGEYLPMRPLLSRIGLSRLVPGDVDFWPGPGPRTLSLPAGPGRPALKMGVQICYEIIFSGQVVEPAHRPDFLFNPSNDAWFGTWGPPQHLAQARMRAIEEGLPVIRSTPTGISALVDARGTILHGVPHQTAGFIAATLPPSAAPTPFSRLGNLAPGLLALLLVGLAIATRRASR
ncbi:apolipoprotein N-acyltransferase [soil metagenome]